MKSPQSPKRDIRYFVNKAIAAAGATHPYPGQHLDVSASASFASLLTLLTLSHVHVARRAPFRQKLLLGGKGLHTQEDLNRPNTNAGFNELLAQGNAHYNAFMVKFGERPASSKWPCPASRTHNASHSTPHLPRIAPATNDATLPTPLQRTCTTSWGWCMTATCPTATRQHTAAS